MACYGSPYDCYDDECYRACYEDIDCSTGEVCTDWGTCEWSGTCSNDADCLSDYECDLERRTCEPRPPDSICRSHMDCDIFERCDEESGACVDADPCDADAACSEGESCDLEYEICVPCGPDGCDGEPVCADLTDEASCQGSAGCQSIYRGLDCRSPDGGDCTEGAQDCQCDRFVFDHCVTEEPDSQLSSMAASL